MAQKKTPAKKATENALSEDAATEAVASKSAPKAVATTATKTSKPVKAAEKALEVPAVVAAAALSDAAAITVDAVKDAIEATALETIVAPATRLMETGADQAREAYARARATSEQIRQTMTETATATTRGALEINSKVLDAWRAQSDVTIALWRQALAAGSVSEAIVLQANGARQIYETAATHWKDVAETTTRWIGASVKPLQAALTTDAR
jgi:hypothetical protein